MNRSSRAQATQIASLRKRINKVYRACKPEMKVAHGDVMDKDFSNSTFASTWTAWTPPVISQGAGDNQRVGNKVYRRDTYKFTLTYSNNAQTSSGLHDGETSMGVIRFIGGIWRETKTDASTPTADQIIHGYGTSASSYNVNFIQPLSDGVTAEHQIYYDKIVKVDLSTPNTVVKIQTPFYLQRYDSAGLSAHSWLLAITGDLDWDTTFNEWIECHGVRKTVFKDA